ncbi:uncharacterized protein AB675_3107 [Cyphellophora attinorum]|uniref:Uncharacterized protein n=1 Tax=Cyphellophora attinorum TaxID=1664694 RepID=A0A0N1H160_9EURO|nr:uncharacterized protein AB675_3107 [Phialophora attinorum]KPI37950.1 hypothetical protein AB675_3107 [Phialophora attinorum]
MEITQRTDTSSTAAPEPHANYPSLTPAYTFNFRIGGPASPVGGLTRGQPLTVVHIIGGRVTSAPRQSDAPLSTGAGGVGGGDGSGSGNTGNPREAEAVDELPRLEATVRGQGIDFVRNDPDGGRMRLDAGLVVEDGDGAMIHIHYTGIVEINDQLSAILAGRRDARDTEFGASFIHVTFETGSEKYKELERGVFVGAGRFILDRGGLGVEYKVSRVGWKPP